ncbi:uncharacterized protein CMC5_042980 [Chondromyces crocatus]|uniref:Uncharacterized protein n=1 Tax=Chondromyces crocatus TaxID=52 RepID=A0A0K1EH10_CHOCO|nr:uncharacterized protein CMC5_042980 [Chondromyces crocatus]
MTDASLSLDDPGSNTMLSNAETCAVRRRVLILIGIVTVVTSCTTGRIDIYTCPDPCIECAEPCACTEGDCVPPAPIGWEGPILLWHGPPDEAPSCPSHAPAPIYEGHAGLSSEGTCSTCTCTPPVCQFPLGFGVSQIDSSCGGPLLHTELPLGWDGSCLNVDRIHSTLSVVPERAILGGCLPVETSVHRATFGWSTKAMACKSLEPPEACSDRTRICGPKLAASLTGFEVCLFQMSEGKECPAGYGQRRVFYGGVTDDSTCIPCSCAPAEGSRCKTVLGVHREQDCSGNDQDVYASLESTSCREIVAMHPEINSVTGAFLEDQPGSCTPLGGQLVNTGKLLDPVTFCCR